MKILWEILLIWLIAATLAVAAAPEPLGLFKPQADGTFAYQSDVYRIAFNSDGVMVSLQVKGNEFLRPLHGEVGGAGFFVNGKRIVLPSTQANPTGGVIADGINGIFLSILPDRLDMDLGQEVAGGRVEYVFFPAEGITLTPVEKPVLHGKRNEPWQIVGTQATRWSAPDGTAIDVHYDTIPGNQYNGMSAMAVNNPYKTRICGEISFPASSWAGDTATIDWQGAVEDHNFPQYTPVALSGTVQWKGAELPTKPIELLVHVEDYNTLETVATFKLPLTNTQKITPFTWSEHWTQPGPWRINVMAVANDHVIGIKTGVIVYDLPHYLPPLNRPDDFWAFWEKAIADQRALPLDSVLVKDDAGSTKDYNLYTVYITGYAGRRLQGRYGEPTAAGIVPVTIGAGHSGANITAPADAGVCNLLTSMDGMATYRTGMGDRNTSNLFYNYIDALRWVDFLATREKADMKRSIYYSGSRSGPVAIAVLALDPRVKMYISNVPTNNRWDWQVTLPGAGGWGPWSADRKPGQEIQAYTHELSYFNSDNFAERITQPVLIGFGLLDGLSQVSGNLACYTRLASTQKKIYFRAWWGHADGNKEWYDTNAQWSKEMFAR